MIGMCQFVIQQLDVCSLYTKGVKTAGLSKVRVEEYLK